MAVQAAEFLQDAATEHLVAQRMAGLVEDHIAQMPPHCHASGPPQPYTALAAPAAAALESTAAATPAADDGAVAAEGDAASGSSVAHCWMTESILSDFTVGTDRRAKPPEGIIARVAYSPEPQVSGEISRKLYELDYSCLAVHFAWGALPAPLRHLTPAALRTILRCFPLRACTLLPAPLAFLSFESKLATGMHARSVDAASACARRYNSLDVSDADLQRPPFAFLLRYIPLLPPLTRLSITDSGRALVGPFPRRSQRCNRDPPLPSSREALASWLVLRSTARAVAPTLTHLSLARSTVERGVLAELCGALKVLAVLDLSHVSLTAASGMFYSDFERADDINRCLLRLPRLKRLSLEGVASSSTMPLLVSHLTRLTELDLSDRGYKYLGVNAAVNLHSKMMAQLSEVSALVSLNLSGNPICALLSSSQGEPREHFPEVFRALFAGLAKLTALRHLRLARTCVLHGLPADPTDAARSPMTRMTALTSLDLSHTIDIRVACYPGSEPYDICDGKWQGLAKVLGKLLCLRELDMSCAGLRLCSATAMLQSLTGLPCLEKLYLEGNDMSVAEGDRGKAAGLLCSIVRSVQCMPRMRVLNLAGCKLSTGAPPCASIAQEYMRLHGRLSGRQAVDDSMHGLQGQAQRDADSFSVPCAAGAMRFDEADIIDASRRLAALVLEAGLMPCIEILSLSGNGIKEGDVVFALSSFLRDAAPAASCARFSRSREIQVAEDSCMNAGALVEARGEPSEDSDEVDEEVDKSCFGIVVKPMLMKICIVWLVIWTVFAG